ncbi:hypothetical protein UY3_12607 [Chelonia mydas]|uniref:Uncharacterized protein n=1 Tax=Chelonia mydas TaxID=8469 RepID=M7BQ65_CHEMY|nr:hypothetical protein UY3_12607 [Chelonia mydas]
MQQASWLHFSGFPKEVQSTVEDLLFEGTKLFSSKMDESLHKLKNARAALRSVGIYTPFRKKKQGKYFLAQRTRAVPYIQPQRQYDWQRQGPSRRRSLASQLSMYQQPPPNNNF